MSTISYFISSRAQKAGRKFLPALTLLFPIYAASFAKISLSKKLFTSCRSTE